MAYVSSEAFVEITTKLRKTGELSDGRIILDDGSEFKIHKILLATGSGYFNMLFSWHKDQKDFHLKELVSKEAMEQILSWIYSHKLDLHEENLPDVLRTAHYLDCFEVVDQCKDFLMKELCFENVLGFWNFAAIYQILDLEEKFKDFAAYHYSQVQKAEEFYELTQENLQSLLERNDINADEETVFLSLMEWVKFDKDNRQGHLPNLLQLVRLGCLDKEFFEEHVQKNSLIQEGCKGSKSLTNLMQRVGAYFNSPRLQKPDFAKPRTTEDVILVIGGLSWANGNALASIESYDMRAHKWCTSTLEDPLGPRRWMGAAVRGSKLYLIGGYKEGRTLKEGVMMDLAAGGKAKNIAPMNIAREWFCLVSFKEHLYAIGGYNNGSSKSMERYDPQDNQWELMPDMQQGRKWAGCAVVNDLIVVAGGLDDRGNPLDTVEAYNTNTGTWLALPKMTKSRRAPSCAVHKKELYVLGGDDNGFTTWEKYSFSSGRWTHLGELDTGKYKLTLFILDDKLVVIKGETVAIYDEAQKKWRKRQTKMNDRRTGHATALVRGVDIGKEAVRAFQHPSRE